MVGAKRKSKIASLWALEATASTWLQPPWIRPRITKKLAAAPAT